eukprot:11223187-Prorocentrum_lima.AAC.1
MVEKEPRLPEPVTEGSESAPPLVAREILRGPELLPRRRYVLAADIEQLGETPGCPGCRSLAVYGKVYGTARSEECRNR